MDRLLNIGFINVGHWTLKNESINYQLISHQKNKNVLYCFVSNGIIKYIGKTTMELLKRMYGYQNPGPTQTTNIRVNAEIKELLKNKNPIDIFILADIGLFKYGDFKINLAAGLEDTLIYEINPDWNYSGKNRLEEDKDSVNEKEIEFKDDFKMKSKSILAFEIKLGVAYYNQGFFNVSQKYNDNFSVDKAIIEIQLGSNPKNIILGYINRTANINGTPRIMGGKSLSEWIQKNYKQNDSLKVEILSNVSLKLYEKSETKL